MFLRQAVVLNFLLLSYVFCFPMPTSAQQTNLHSMEPNTLLGFLASPEGQTEAGAGRVIAITKAWEKAHALLGWNDTYPLIKADLAPETCGHIRLAYLDVIYHIAQRSGDVGIEALYFLANLDYPEITPHVGMAIHLPAIEMSQSLLSQTDLKAAADDLRRMEFRLAVELASQQVNVDDEQVENPGADQAVHSLLENVATSPDKPESLMRAATFAAAIDLLKKKSLAMPSLRTLIIASDSPVKETKNLAGNALKLAIATGKLSRNLFRTESAQWVQFVSTSKLHSAACYLSLQKRL